MKNLLIVLMLLLTFTGCQDKEKEAQIDDTILKLSINPKEVEMYKFFSQNIIRESKSKDSINCINKLEGILSSLKQSKLHPAKK